MRCRRLGLRNLDCKLEDGCKTGMLETQQWHSRFLVGWWWNNLIKMIFKQLVRLYDTMRLYMIHFVLKREILDKFSKGHDKVYHIVLHYIVSNSASQVLQRGLCSGLMSVGHLSDLRIYLEMNPFPSCLAHGFLLMKRTAGMIRASASCVCLCQSPVLCIPVSFRSSLSY